MPLFEGAEADLDLAPPDGSRGARPTFVIEAVSELVIELLASYADDGYRAQSPSRDRLQPSGPFVLRSACMASLAWTSWVTWSWHQSILPVLALGRRPCVQASRRASRRTRSP